MMKRLLVLTSRFPYPEIGGDRMRILHLCRALAPRFELTLLSLCESEREMSAVPPDRLFSSIERVYLPRWKSRLKVMRAVFSTRPLQLAYYDSPEFRSRLHTLLKSHDLVLAHLVRTGQYIEDLQVPKILEMTDAISMNYLCLRQVRDQFNFRKLIYLLEQPRLHAYEVETLRRFDRVWLTARSDRDFLAASANSAVEVIPNGTSLCAAPCPPPHPSDRVIIFIGSMVSLQNQDACRYFIRQILPGVRARADVVFRIVGRAPAAVMREFAQWEGVELTGTVDRIEDGIAGGFCGVSPVRIASGIQNKVLEYLALGLPCVASTLSLRGVDAVPGEQVLAFDHPAQAVEQILALRTNPALRGQIADRGKRFVCEKHDWTHIYRNVLRSCEDTLARAARVELDSAS